MEDEVPTIEDAYCFICKKKIDEVDKAWFFIGEEGYYPGAPAICDGCMRKMLEEKGIEVPE